MNEAEEETNLADTVVHNHIVNTYQVSTKSQALWKMQGTQRQIASCFYSSGISSPVEIVTNFPGLQDYPTCIISNPFFVLSPMN